MDFRSKVIPLAHLADWRAGWRARGQRLVVTNGCFDLLHLGHATYLEAARRLGDGLLVGVNGDAAVQALKGPGRPLNGEADRAALVAALEAVAAVTVFPEVTATRFLTLAGPDIYVKGGDYTLATLNQEERRAVEGAGGRIVLLPLVPGKSTRGLVRQMQQPPGSVPP